MNELQQVEFDMLQVFVNICDELNLNYFLVCGSTLGAMKYQGFIPWDDDIDVAMCRKDYDRFIRCAAKCLPSNMVLQNHLSDSNVPFIYSKLRLENTTFIEKTASKLDISHGTYIDIFPLDGYPSNKFKAFFFEIKKRIVWRILSSSYYRDNRLKNIIVFPLYLFSKLLRRSMVNYYEKLVSSYSFESSKLWCNYGNSPMTKEYAPCEQYGNGIWATFEGLKVRIPERYDEYLTQKYGDWRADLPEEQKVGHHYAEVIDLSRPYTDYIVKLKNGKIRLKTSEELLSSGITPPEGYKY